MSAVLASLAGLQSMAVPMTAPLTAESLTKPNTEVACRVVGMDGYVRSVAFRVHGSRGYPTGKLPAFASTPAKFEVVEDQTGFFAAAETLYDNISFAQFSGNWRDAKLGRFSKDGQSLTLIQFFPSQNNGSTVVFQRQTKPLMSAMPDFAYAGACTAKMVPQTPLAAAPIDKDSSK